ncbi:MAG: hypothetical protein AAGA03_10895, partial [Planctomycetota bacterium]
FVCASDPSHGGYSVWRLDHDLEMEPAELIRDDLRGCCGQMDIQCCDDLLVVSENGSFQVGLFDRNGRRQGSFGHMDRSSQDGFGSCCNPMNSLPLSDGTILTAESSIGHIKRFDTDGDFVAYVGKASIGVGCKHCALGHDAKNDLYYMMYQGKGICVLGNSDDYPETEAERAVAKRQQRFLDQYAGTWSKSGKEPKSSSPSFFGGLFGGSNDADSMLPFSSFTVQQNGEVTLHGGQYAAFMTESRLELLPAEEDDGDDDYRIALADNQVRMVEAKLTIRQGKMNVDFGSGITTELMRVGGESSLQCGEGCDGSTCDSESCQTEQSSSDIRLVEAAAPEDSDPFGPLALADPFGTSESTTPVTARTAETYAAGTFEYKLISKRQLGEDRASALNQMGSEGWEYCGKLGKQLLFKRTSASRSTEESR